MLSKSYADFYIIGATAYAEKAAHEKEGLVKALEEIKNTMQDLGRKGCTYGETDYDSLSAAFGYNLCLSKMQSIATKALAAYQSSRNKNGKEYKRLSEFVFGV